MERSKRVLLTGAGGAIGVHMLAHILKNTDWFVICTDSFKTEHKGYYDRLTRLSEDCPDFCTRVKIIVHDLCTPLTSRQKEKIGKIDYVINLASMSDVQASIDDPIPFVRNNTELMLNMCEYMRELKPEAFLHFSTDEVYGPTEKDSKGHKEWAAILPSNPYSASKAAQEAIAIAWWRSYGVPLIITNTMNNFGEMQSPSKYPAMIQKKIGECEPIMVHAASLGEVGTRYYIHSRNTADAVIYILQNIPAQLHKYGHTDRPLRYNIVGDAQIANDELPQIIAKLMGEESIKIEYSYFHKDNPGHDLHYGLDGTLLAEAGWKSPKSFEESMKETIEWQKRNKEWMK